MPNHYKNYTVDHRSKKAMINFLDAHRTHRDGLYANPTIANCIKITHMGIPSDLMDYAWEMIANPAAYHVYVGFDFEIDRVAFEQDNPGYAIQITGRSGGWIELVTSGRGYSVLAIHDPELSTESPIDDIRRLAEAVENFDHFCDCVRENFIDRLEEYRADQQEKQAAEENEADALREEIPFPAFQ